MNIWNNSFLLTDTPRPPTKLEGFVFKVAIINRNLGSETTAKLPKPQDVLVLLHYPLYIPKDFGLGTRLVICLNA